MLDNFPSLNVCSVSFQEIPGVIRGLICFDTPGRWLGWLGKGSCFIPMVFFWKSDVSERGPSNPWIISDHHFISCSIIFPYIFRNWMAITWGYWYPISRQPLDFSARRFAAKVPPNMRGQTCSPRHRQTSKSKRPFPCPAGGSLTDYIDNRREADLGATHTHTHTRTRIIGTHQIGTIFWGPNSDLRVSQLQTCLVCPALVD